MFRADEHIRRPHVRWAEPKVPFRMQPGTRGKGGCVAFSSRLVDVGWLGVVTIGRRPSDTEPPRIRSVDRGVEATGIGTVLDGRYRVEAVVGRGGTSTVYRATDGLLGRSVAVKLFSRTSRTPLWL